MPALTEAQLKEQIKSGELAPVYFFYGEETHLKRYYCNRLIAKVLPGERNTFNFQTFDWKECSAQDVIDAAEQLPMMAERKCVLVKDLDAEGAAAEVNRLCEYLEAPSEDCVLVIRLDSVAANPKKSAKWRKFLKNIEKTGCSVCFAHRTGAALHRILIDSAARQGCKMDSVAASYLVSRCGNDLQQLLGEVAKICAYAKGQPITRQHIDAVTSAAMESTVFDLSRALVRGEYLKAFRLLDELFFRREEPVAVLSVLSSAYVDLYRAKVAAVSGGDAMALTKDFDYKGKDFRLKNAVRDSTKLTIGELRRALDILSEADLQLKGSRTEGRIVLEQAVARLAQMKSGGETL
ncbi:MAG: DNA polymerase III subunit delta [Clostridiales bacterium]|nr:DNA polymerase III subunit delta [Clostridiales bacterium]